jgi:hypothetical protein
VLASAAKLQGLGLAPDGSLRPVGAPLAVLGLLAACLAVTCWTQFCAGFVQPTLLQAWRGGETAPERRPPSLFASEAEGEGPLDLEQEWSSVLLSLFAAQMASLVLRAALHKS